MEASPASPDICIFLTSSLSSKPSGCSAFEGMGTASACESENSRNAIKCFSSPESSLVTISEGERERERERGKERKREREQIKSNQIKSNQLVSAKRNAEEQPIEKPPKQTCPR